jgi:hypothetical protein
MQFTGNRCTTNVVILLNYQHIESSLGEVSRVSQAVVTGTDDDRIVTLHDNISRAAL